MRRVLPLLVLLAAVPQATAARSGPPSTVTSFANDGPGTLRAVLATASGGDVVRFAEPGTVQLARPVVVPAGVTIDGHAGTSRADLRYVGGRTGSGGAGVLDVHEPNVTLTGLRLEGTVQVQHVTGFEATDDEFAGRGVLALGLTTDAHISHSTFSGPQGITLDLDAATHVEANTFNGGSSLDGIADRPLVEHNTFRGSHARLQLNGGRFAANTFVGGRLQPLSVSAATGTVTLSGNTFELHYGSVRLLADDGTIVSDHTTVTGDGLLRLGCTDNAGPGARIRVSHSSVTRALGVLAECGSALRVDLDHDTFTGSRTDGLHVDGKVDLHSRDDTIRGNGDAGVRVLGAARAELLDEHMGGNGGAGILSTAPARPSAKLEHNRLHGDACPGCRVQVYAADGDEGANVIGEVRAGPDGSYVFPARGSFSCPSSGAVTVTSTTGDGRTSKFAVPLTCACVVDAKVRIDLSRVPVNGFWNAGISVSFLRGTTIGGFRLIDTATGKTPLVNALGSTVTWTLDENKAGPPDPDPKRFRREWFATVADNHADGEIPHGPTQTWRFVVDYTPPRGATKCGAVVEISG